MFWELSELHLPTGFVDSSFLDQWSPKWGAHTPGGLHHDPLGCGKMILELQQYMYIIYKHIYIHWECVLEHFFTDGVLKPKSLETAGSENSHTV